jgi:hypothetical protein
MEAKFGPLEKSSNVNRDENFSEEQPGVLFLTTKVIKKFWNT